MHIQNPPIDQLLRQLAVKYEINEKWIEDLMNLVMNKYPPSDLTGNYQALVRDVTKVIEDTVSASESVE